MEVLPFEKALRRLRALLELFPLLMLADSEVKVAGWGMPVVCVRGTGAWSSE